MTEPRFKPGDEVTVKSGKGKDSEVMPCGVCGSRGRMEPSFAPDRAEVPYLPPRAWTWSSAGFGWVCSETCARATRSYAVVADLRAVMAVLGCPAVGGPWLERHRDA